MKPWLLISVLLCIGSCNRPADSLRSPSEIHRLTVEDAVVRFGSLTRENEVFSRIVDASLSRSGRFVVVLDEAPPFVHVFDRQDGAAWTFGVTGEGPGELRDPYSLEVLADTVLLVLNGNGIDWFKLDGTWKQRNRLGELGLLASAITTGCSDRVFVYGRSEGGTSSDTVSWLHELRLDSTPPNTTALKVWGSVSPVRFGSIEGLDATNEAVLLWHRSDWSQTGWWLPCSSLQPIRLTSRSATLTVSEEQVIDSERTAVKMSISYSDTLAGGAAISGRTSVVSLKWWRKGQEHTTLEFHSAETCSALNLLGHWALYDATPTEMVLGYTDLVPETWIVSSGTLAALSEPNTCTI
jgi:hypothetical protein